MAEEKPQQKDANTKQGAAEPDFNGAAIIDGNGVEIPITEEMIKNACDQLDNSKT
jgi:hypothetical protein